MVPRQHLQKIKLLENVSSALAMVGQDVSSCRRLCCLGSSSEHFCCTEDVAGSHQSSLHACSVGQAVSEADSGGRANFTCTRAGTSPSVILLKAALPASRIFTDLLLRTMAYARHTMSMASARRMLISSPAEAEGGQASCWLTKQ